MLIIEVQAKSNRISLSTAELEENDGDILSDKVPDPGSLCLAVPNLLPFAVAPGFAGPGCSVMVFFELLCFFWMVSVWCWQPLHAIYSMPCYYLVQFAFACKYSGLSWLDFSCMPAKGHALTRAKLAILPLSSG